MERRTPGVICKQGRQTHAPSIHTGPSSVLEAKVHSTAAETLHSIACMEGEVDDERHGGGKKRTGPSVLG